MRDFDKEIQEHKEAIRKIEEEKAKYNADNVARLKEELSKLSSGDFLELIEHETTIRRRNRDEIRGGNDIEINKLNMVLKDEFWCVKIYILIQNGQYKGFTQELKEAEKFCDDFLEKNYREEIVDLRGIY